MAERTSITETRFYRIGAFAYRRRALVIVLWIVAFIALMAPLRQITDRLSQGGFEVRGSQSEYVRKAVQRDFPGRTDLTDLLVLRSTDPNLTAHMPEFRLVFSRIRDELSKQPGIAFVSRPYQDPERSISFDERVVTAVVGLSGDQDSALKNNPKHERAVYSVPSPGIDVYLTGAAPFYKAFADTTKHDLERAERIAFPITLVILLIAFGSVVAAGVPLLLAVIGLAVSFGIISIIAATTTVSTFAQNISSMIGIGVGIDYSLFVLTRFREQLADGRSASQGVAEAMASSGKAVFVSAVTVVVALAGTQLVDIPAFRSMGFSAMIAVAVAGASALTLLPALLGFLGPRVNEWSVRKNKTSESRTWHRWAMAVMRRPWVALAGSLAILAVLAAPALGLRIGSSGSQILPPDAKPRQAAEVVAGAFGEGQVAPVEVLYEDPRGVASREAFAGIYAVAAQIAKDPQVVRVDSIATVQQGTPPDLAFDVMQSSQAHPFVSQIVSPEGTRTLMSIVTRRGAQDDATVAFVERLRRMLPRAAPPQARTWIGGDPGLNADLNNAMTDALPSVVGLVMLLSFLVLMLFFRSVLLPLKAIAMNMASVLATYGILVVVFQNGAGEGLLGFESTGNIDAFLPLFLFCILFGLSMDYEVFMLARIREEYLKTRDNTEAVGWGLEHTAKIITSAAAIMVTVFGAFAAASLVPIKAMGFGLAVAVLLDATLIRTVLVPATMRLMGDWNWWMPKWLDRILPELSLDEPVVPQEHAETRTVSQIAAGDGHPPIGTPVASPVEPSPEAPEQAAAAAASAGEVGRVVPYAASPDEPAIKPRAAAKKTSAKKTAAKKTAAKKTAADGAPAKKTAAKKTAARRAPAKKTAAKKIAEKKTVAKKTAAP